MFVFNDAMMRFSEEVLGVDVDGNVREIRQFVQQLMPSFHCYRMSFSDRQSGT